MKQTTSYVIILILIFSQRAYTQSLMTRGEYIENYKKLAIREMFRSGIPASITMAQGCLESDNGNSPLAKSSNNHFGIKCKSDWKGERSYHDDDQLNECFRKYRTVYESYEDHTTYLMQNPRYAYLFKLSNKDYNAWANGLKAAGYATDPNYAARLIKIIEDEGLQSLDDVTPDDLPSENILAKEGHTNDAYTVRDKGKSAFKNITIDLYKTRDVKTLNGLDIIYIKNGDTYEGIASEFNMKPWELHAYNDLKKGDPLPPADSYLYLERKHCRAQKGNEFHTVLPGETMHDIAQIYGVTEKSLYFKNRIKKGTEPAAGTQVYLRKMKPKHKSNYSPQ